MRVSGLSARSGIAYAPVQPAYSQTRMGYAQWACAKIVSPDFCLPFISLSKPLLLAAGEKVFIAD
jgi:hypothetical protein